MGICFPPERTRERVRGQSTGSRSPNKKPMPHSTRARQSSSFFGDKLSVSYSHRTLPSSFAKLMSYGANATQSVRSRAARFPKRLCSIREFNTVFLGELNVGDQPSVAQRSSSVGNCPSRHPFDSTRKGTVRLTVRDQELGIAPKKRGRLFEPFQT